MCHCPLLLMLLQHFILIKTLNKVSKKQSRVSFAKSQTTFLNPLLQAQVRTKQAQQGQPNLTLLKDADTQGILLAIEKADKSNPTTKKQINRIAQR